MRKVCYIFFILLFSVLSFSQFESQTELESLVNKLRQAESSFQSKNTIKDISKLDAENPSGVIEVSSNGNIITVKMINGKQYTLLLSAKQFNFGKEIQVYTNGKLSFQGIVTKDIETLLKWFKKDLDRTMLFGHELTIKI